MALQRSLSRQHKGSNRRVQTRQSLARLHGRLTDRRTDWVEQVTTALARTYDLIALEDLNTAGMVRRPKPKPDPDKPAAFLPNGARAKAGLNRAILASCWGTFATRLGHKTTVVFVDPRNTSRACHECGHTDTGNRESQAVFQCQRCGHTAHADINAARNILERAASSSTNPRASGARTRQSRKGRVNQPAAA